MAPTALSLPQLGPFFIHSWKRKVWLVKSWRYDSTEEKTRGAHFTVSRLPGHKGPDVTGIYLAGAVKIYAQNCLQAPAE